MWYFGKVYGQLLHASARQICRAQVFPVRYAPLPPRPSNFNDLQTEICSKLLKQVMLVSKI